MLSMCSSAHFRTSCRSGGVHASRQRFSRYSDSVSGIGKHLLDGFRRELHADQPHYGPALQRGRQILLCIGGKALGRQVPPTLPEAALNLDEEAGLRPGKIRPPAARGRKAVFPLQFRPTCGIPQRGEAGFPFRDFEAVLHTVKRVVKTQGVCSRRKCPPQQAPVR